MSLLEGIWHFLLEEKKLYGDLKLIGQTIKNLSLSLKSELIIFSDMMITQRLTDNWNKVDYIIKKYVMTSILDFSFAFGEDLKSSIYYFIFIFNYIKTIKITAKKVKNFRIITKNINKTNVINLMIKSYIKKIILT